MHKWGVKLTFSVQDSLEAVRQKAEMNCFWMILQLKIFWPFFWPKWREKIVRKKLMLMRKEKLSWWYVSSFELNTTCYSLQNIAQYQYSKLSPWKDKRTHLWRKQDGYLKTYTHTHTHTHTHIYIWF
jgi:hypothetical protein